ncbi:MAG: hypothetical protein M1431_05185 [Candidatus Thermoplasmatota archaeon]|nr:hypothetical protein [Candidatus Thermoplasmatota archaeon]
MVDDTYSRVTFLREKDVTVEVNYRLGFDADRTCGYSRIYKGEISDSQDEENYEIYQELYECGLSVEEVEKRYRKLIDEVLEGKIDVDF